MAERRWAVTARGLGVAASLLIAAGAALRPPPAVATMSAKAEQALLVKVNAARGRAGLPALTWDDRLQQAAERHAAAMAARGKLSHQLAGEAPLAARIAAAGEVAPAELAENVAVGPGAAAVHEQLMASPPHRANILSATLNAVGIGAVSSGGELWVTEDFARQPPARDAAGMAGWIAARMAEARRARRLAPLPRRAAPALQQTVCRLAARGSLDPHAALALFPQAAAATVFSTFGATPLPPRLLIHLRDAAAYSLAVCFARNEAYPNGVYWAAVVFFP